MTSHMDSSLFEHFFLRRLSWQHYIYPYIYGSYVEVHSCKTLQKCSRLWTEQSQEGAKDFMCRWCFDSVEHEPRVTGWTGPNVIQESEGRESSPPGSCSSGSVTKSLKHTVTHPPAGGEKILLLLLLLCFLLHFHSKHQSECDVYLTSVLEKMMEL